MKLKDWMILVGGKKILHVFSVYALHEFFDKLSWEFLEKLSDNIHDFPQEKF